MADVDIRVKARDEASGILKSISQGILQGFGQAAFGAITNAIGGATQAMAGFVMEGISKASNLNESINKTNVVFGDAADAMIKWSESAATSIGMSQQSALDAAGGFAVFGKAAGLAGADVTKFAQDGLSRAADMASIFNTSVEDASMAMQAAFRGETEPIRRYGVMLDDATMRQKALSMGIISTTKEALTPQQKVLAANALIMESTAFTMGDFQNTADGMANSQRILNAQIENAQAQLGTMFLPIVTKVMGFLNTQGIPILQEMMKAFQEFAGPILEKAGEVFSNFTALINEGFTPIGAVVDTLKKFTGIDLDGFITGLGDFAKNAQELGASIMSQLQPGLQSFGRFFEQQGPTIQKIGEVMLAKFAEVGQWFAAEILPFLIAQFTKLGNWFANNGPLITRFGAVLAAVFGGILVAAQTLWVFLKPIMDGIINIFLDLIQFVMQVFTGDFAGAFATLNQIVVDAWTAVKTAFSDLTAWVMGWFGTDIEAVKAQWSSFFTGLWNTIVKWWTGVKTTWSSNWNALKQILTTVTNMIMTTIINWLRSIITSIIGFAVNLYNAWKSAWDTLINAVIEATAGIIVAVITLVTNVIAAIQAQIVNFLAIGAAIVKAIQDGITAAWNAFLTWLIDLVKGLITSILALFGIGGEGADAMQAAGYGMMQSFARGILQGAGLPRMALATVSMNMGGMGGGGAYNSPGGMRTGNTYQRNNIYGPVTLQMNGGRGTELLKIK